MWLTIVTFMAGRENNPRVAWHGFWQVIALAACYFSARGILIGAQSRGVALLILVVGCMAVAGHGVQQVFVTIPRDRANYQQDPEKILRQLNIDAPAGSAARKRFEDRLFQSQEPYATFALANSLASLLAAAIIVLVGVWLHQWALVRTANSSSLDWAALIVLGLCLSLVVLTWFLARGRTSYLATGIAVGYWAFYARQSKQWSPKALALATTAVLAILTVGFVWLLRNDTLVLTEAPKSLAFRLEYWLGALRMLRDHWLFGVGLGNFQNYYPQYKLPTASETVADPHNWILDIACTLSVALSLVIIAWVARFFAWPAVATLPGNRSLPVNFESSILEISQSRDARRARQLLWGALIGGIGCGIILDLLSELDLAELAWSWVPAIVVGWLVHRPVQSWVATQPLLPLRTAALALILCLLANSSWQASGLAVPLLLLLIFSSVPTPQEIPAQPDVEPYPGSARSDPKLNGSRWLTVVLPALGLGCFIFQSWRPTTMAWALRQQVASAPTVQQQWELAQAAAAADPLDSDALSVTAHLRFVDASLSTSATFPPLAQQAAESYQLWLSSDSKKYSNWMLAGNRMLDLATMAGDRQLPQLGWIENSLEFYGQAATRYPSSVEVHAQLAATYAAAALTEPTFWKNAFREYHVAIDLSEATPHLDKKVSGQVLWLPVLPAGLLPEDPRNQSSSSQPWIAAEQIFEWIRTQESALKKVDSPASTQSIPSVIDEN
jgi:hypothetical protein